ncbi:MAG: SDR family NAD(P)-dependent oxidoreductase [Clostridiales Family XIII bacterium]|nr:SDR family NAD(P)-dependent oxidoreductase [Clostridiales Family XIII bacterium]
MSIAVITGASSGMGRDFAEEIARIEDLDEIWLIARREDKLKELAGSLPCPARIFALDLIEQQSIDSYAKALTETAPEIAYLVNASGFGRFAYAPEVPLKDDLDMIDLNVKALTALCFLSIPYMKPGSYIINMGSLSSFQPVPYINIYGATKAYVLSFTRALNVELRPLGIRAMAVCPGWVKTEFFDHAVTDNGAVTYYNKLWESKDVIVKAMKDLKKGKDVSVLGAGVRFQVLLCKLLPHRLVMKVWMKQQKHSDRTA